MLYFQNEDEEVLLNAEAAKHVPDSLPTCHVFLGVQAHEVIPTCNLSCCLLSGWKFSALGIQPK